MYKMIFITQKERCWLACLYKIIADIENLLKQKALLYLESNIATKYVRVVSQDFEIYLSTHALNWRNGMNFLGSEVVSSI